MTGPIASHVLDSRHTRHCARQLNAPTRNSDTVPRSPGQSRAGSDSNPRPKRSPRGHTTRARTSQQTSKLAHDNNTVCQMMMMHDAVRPTSSTTSQAPDGRMTEPIACFWSGWPERELRMTPGSESGVQRQRGERGTWECLPLTNHRCDIIHEWMNERDRE